MTEIRFYHLQRKSLDQALPPLLEKVLERGWRAVVLAGSEQRVEALNLLLWTANPASFLPHGSRRDGSPAEQPIWLTTEAENPNLANVLILTDGAETDCSTLPGITLVCDLFDGNDAEAVAAARRRWRTCKAAGHDLTYWQQSPGGGWERKAGS
ncbi:MAG: DNA polymerase III subunit chi [Rhodospirillaceae bacterium]